MKFKRRFLSGMGVLAFAALMALNVQMANSYNIERTGANTLSLVEMESKAQSGEESSCLGGTFIDKRPLVTGTCHCQGKGVYSQLCYGQGTGCTIILCD